MGVAITSKKALLLGGLLFCAMPKKILLIGFGDTIAMIVDEATKCITPAKASFRKKLPGKALWIIFPV